MNTAVPRPPSQSSNPARESQTEIQTQKQQRKAGSAPLWLCKPLDLVGQNTQISTYRKNLHRGPSLTNWPKGMKLGQNTSCYLPRRNNLEKPKTDSRSHAEATSAGISWAPKPEMDTVNTTRGKTLSHTSSLSHSYTQENSELSFWQQNLKY